MSWIDFIVRGFPNTPIGKKLRTYYWNKRIQRIGRNSAIYRMAQIELPQLMTIGDNFILGEYAIVNPGESAGIYIGNNVSIAKGSFVRAANHRISKLDIPMRDQGHEYSSIQYNGSTYSIVIEDNVWIGAHVVILSGAKIGTGSVIAAGSVVSSEIPPNSIVVGNPGRVVSNRFKKFGVDEKV